VKTPAPERAASRRKLAAKGQALKDGSFPISDVDHLKKAIRSVGRAPASKRPALKRLIRKRAAELKATNAPGVKGTWPFQAHANDDTEAIDLATPRRMPVVRGAADVQLSRTGPGVITAMHKSTGMKIGTITPQGRGYAGTHADGKATGASGGQQGALAGLIAYHNQMAAKTKARAAAGGAKTFTAGETDAVDLAGALPTFTPAASASDGPRVTSMGTKPAKAAKPAAKTATPPGLSPYGAQVYAKLIAKGLKPAVALAMAKRADAMHAKAA
jgi:hypothetical protein